MNSLVLTLHLIALAVYVPTAAWYGAILFLKAPAAPTAHTSPSRSTKLRFPLLVLGLLVHFGAIGAWCVLMRRSPFASEFGTLSVLAWTIAIAFAAVDLRYRLPAVGAAALPVACVVLFWAMLNIHAPVADSRILTNRIVSLHVLTILASYALFAVAFGCASLYLLQNRLLKTHGVLRRLPPLTTLDKIAYHSVAFALPLLTLGLALGIAYVYSGAARALGQPTDRWLTDTHNIVGFVTWLLYVLYLTARLVMGWRGVRLQYILIAGLVVALALYALPSSTHRFAPTRSASLSQEILAFCFR